MASKAEVERSLRIISRAWGKRQSGYVFLPWIDREKQKKTGSRKAGFNEGPAFKWPQERDKIIDHMLAHQHHDLYWSVMPFEYPMRREDAAMDEHALWADLDKVDPRDLTEYPPTIAWESSPGRYQALWIAGSGDFQGASWPGNENQRLTYMIGADPSGWDTVQLLRVPGWRNHKPEYEQNGEHPKGKLLWHNGPLYHPGDFSDLPEVKGLESRVTDAIEADVENVDRLEVLARVRLKLSRRVRDLLAAREASGDRSDALWEIERSLADVGCSVAEIVAIVRETVWNKFRDRSNELSQLILEASKAIAARPPEVVEKLEEEDVERDEPQRLGFLLKNIKRPTYIVDKVLTEGAVGFIAGEPKCYKSWVGLDMALSVSTGAPFLGLFRVTNPGPVFYIQEEDPPTTLKSRSAKIFAGKGTDKLVLEPDTNEVLWLPPEKEPEFDPDIMAYVQKGVTISDEAWQLWLDEQLAKGINGEPYRLMIIDTLMMTAGDVEETRSQEMTTKIFKPLKTLARKYNTAILVVHHMGKADRPRAGQRMLGSVANHAWSEDSLYLSRAGASDIRMEIESKTAPGGTFRISNLHNTVWEPEVMPWRQEEATPNNDAKPRSRPAGNAGATAKARVMGNKLVETLREAGANGMTTAQVAEAMGITRSTAHKRLMRQVEYGTITRDQLENGSNRWTTL